jgi:hypothetical protein
MRVSVRTEPLDPGQKIVPYNPICGIPLEKRPKIS